MFSLSEFVNRLLNPQLDLQAEDDLIDPLTRLPMRPSVVQHLGKCLSASRGKQPVALAIVDFTNVQGLVEAGSAGESDLLVRLSRLLRSNVPEHHLVGHLRDREFAVILSGTPIQDAEHLADQIIDSLRTDESLSKERRYIATAVGIGFSSKGNCSASHLMTLADIALHYALAAGSSVHAIVDRVPQAA